MAVSLRLIRARVKSIKNTKKITKAMELVSAAKMRKAVAANLASRAYSSAARKIIEDVAGRISAEEAHHLMIPRTDVKKVLMIVFTSDRGLCGSFNAQVVRLADTEVKARQAKGQGVQLVSVGKRGAMTFKIRGLDADHIFSNLSNNPTAQDVWPIAKIAVKGFMDGSFDEVMLAFTDFKSALVQTPRVTRLLPFIADVQAEDVGEYQGDYAFEPSPKELLDTVVPRLVETLIYQALLESNASEHSARMMNMKNATSNASDMIDDFTLMMNQVRQAGITREISEISAGKAALE
jgi:F-type H+-transporting ATPase subunit gamma